MNPHTATLDELRNWLAADSGWYCVNSPRCGANWYHDGDVLKTGDHPYPPTLDGAASAMPEGWYVDSISDYTFADGDESEEPHWSGYAFAKHRDMGEFAKAPDEITLRYRLAALCRIAEKENKQ